jgi:hypothetical protein
MNAPRGSKFLPGKSFPELELAKHSFRNRAEQKKTENTIVIVVLVHHENPKAALVVTVLWTGLAFVTIIR